MFELEEVVVLFEEYAEDVGLKPHTKQNYSDGVFNFARFLNASGTHFLLAERDDVIAWLDGPLAAISPSTARLYCSALKMFYQWLDDRELCDNPVRRIVIDGKRPGKRALRPEAAKRVLEACREAAHAPNATEEAKRDYAFVCMHMRCYIRQTEIIEANVRDFVANGTTGVLMTKGWGTRPQPGPVLLDRETTEAIERYLAARRHIGPDSPLIASASRRNRGGRLHFCSTSRILNKALSVVGEATTGISMGKTALDLAYSEGASEAECREFARTRSMNLAMESAKEHDRRRGLTHERIARALDGASADTARAVITGRELRAIAEAFSHDDVIAIRLEDDGSVSFALASPSHGEEDPKSCGDPAGAAERDGNASSDQPTER